MNKEKHSLRNFAALQSGELLKEIPPYIPQTWLLIQKEQILKMTLTQKNGSKIKFINLGVILLEKRMFYSLLHSLIWLSPWFLWNWWSLVLHSIWATLYSKGTFNLYEEMKAFWNQTHQEVTWAWFGKRFKSLSFFIACNLSIANWWSNPAELTCKYFLRKCSFWWTQMSPLTIHLST